MSDRSLPEAVGRHLERNGLNPSDCAALSFAADWSLTGRSGAQARLGLEAVSDQRVIEAFREVCVGLSRVRGTFLPQVELPTGGVADLHLVAEADRFHAVLIDVRAAVEQARAHQQALQDAKLELYERRRELVDVRSKLKRAQAELRTAQTRLVLERELALQSEWQLSAAREVIADALGSLAQQPRTLPLAQARVQEALGRLEVRDSERPLPLATLADRVAAAAATLARQRGLGFELRQENRSELSLKLPLTSTLATLTSAVAQALWRTPQGRVEAELRWDGIVLRLKVSDRGPELNNQQRQQLWEQRLPTAEEGPAAATLFALGWWLREAGGRVTMETVAGGSVLTLSLSPGRLDGEVTERMGGGGRVWLCGADAGLLHQLDDALEPLGIQLEALDADTALAEHALLNPPDALLLALPPGQSAKLAFKLRGRGFRGRLVLLLTDADPGTPALPAQSGLDAQLAWPATREALLRAIRGPGA